MEDVNGEYTEMAETNPVHSEAPGKSSMTVFIILYCNTHDNGEGWHYEWIRVVDNPADVAELPEPGTLDEDSPSSSLPDGGTDSWIHGSDIDRSDSDICI